MTASSEKNKELELLQIELKKAIQNHQIVRLKLSQESSEALKNELISIQRHIQELGEKQKNIISNIRKENTCRYRLEITANGEARQSATVVGQPVKAQVVLPQTSAGGATNNSSNCNTSSNSVKKQFVLSKNETNRNSSRPALAVRTISGQTKLLVPVSAAAATAKKQNQHQQILVVPTPGGGARLATSAPNPGSLLRPLRIDAKNHSNSSNCNSNASCNSQSNHNNNNNGTSNSYCKSLLATSTTKSHSSVNVQQQNVTRQQLLREQLARQAQQEELKVPEPKRKESFLAALGLVTKEALSEIQNKKCERKRRTTANPQFSNAAIEAKRISALAVAEKRAKRRMLLAEAASNKPPHTSRNFLQSRNRAQKVRANEQVRQRNVPKKEKEVVKERVTITSSTSVTITNISSGEAGVNTLTTSNSSTTTTANINSTSNVASVNRSLSGSKVSNNCFVCDELCDPDLDAVMFCKDCRCLFHATCASDIDDITKNLSVPCPKCDKQKPLEEEVGPSDTSSEIDLKEIREEEKMEEEEEAEEEAMEEEEDEPPLVVEEKTEKELDEAEEDGNEKEEDAPREEVEKKDDLLLERREKREELRKRRRELTDEMEGCKKRIGQLRVELASRKEETEVLLRQQSKIKETISNFTAVVEMIKNSSAGGATGDPLGSMEDTCRLAGDLLKSGRADQLVVESANKENYEETVDHHSHHHHHHHPASGDVEKEVEFPPTTLIIHGDNLQHGMENMVIVGDKTVEVIVVDAKLDQFEDETSAAVASIQGIQDQIEVDL